MSGPGPAMPLWMRIKANVKGFAFSLPFMCVVLVESRDLFFRATWNVEPLPASRYATGDVIAIANRWYTLPTWSDSARSLLTKLLCKSVWDDLGVIVVRDGVPHLLFCDSEKGATIMPLTTFLHERVPRGAALQKLVVEPSFPVPTAEVADLFVREVQKITPDPWYAFRAAYRHGDERKFYGFATEFAALKAKYRKIDRERSGTRQAVEVLEKRLQEFDVMRDVLAERVPDFGAFHLFNGSLVASFLATFGLLDRKLPPVTRYVVQDFAHPMPLKGASFADPVIIFKN